MIVYSESICLRNQNYFSFDNSVSSTSKVFLKDFYMENCYKFPSAKTGGKNQGKKLKGLWMKPFVQTVVAQKVAYELQNQYTKNWNSPKKNCST